MYVQEDQVPVLGALGAAQTGMIPAGAMVLVPAGTVISLSNPMAPQSMQVAVPKTLANPLSLVLAGDVSASGDVESGGLIVDGVSATLDKDAAANPPSSIEGTPVSSDWLASIPAGTLVVIQTLPTDVAVTPVTPTPPVTPSAAAKPWYKSTAVLVAAGTVVVLGALVAGLAINRRRSS